MTLFKVCQDIMIWKLGTHQSHHTEEHCLMLKCISTTVHKFFNSTLFNLYVGDVLYFHTGRAKTLLDRVGNREDKNTQKKHTEKTAYQLDLYFSKYKFCKQSGERKMR